MFAEVFLPLEMLTKSSDFVTSGILASSFK